MTQTFLKGLLFVVPPILVLEVLLRAGCLEPATNYWYRAAVTTACDHKIDMVFVGSSRVAAALDVEAFSQRITQATGSRPSVINMGHGYTTLAEHYFALRNMYDTCGGNLKGADVLVEAAEGLPESSTFEDRWVHPDEPALIVSLLRPADFSHLWMSRTRAAAKIDVTARHLMRTIGYVEYFRIRLLNRGERTREAVARRVFGETTQPEIAGDLTAAGGILVDREGIERARRLAVSLASDQARDQREVEDWSATVLMEMNRLVRANGGRLIVFNMPLSSVQRYPYHTAIRRADAARFRRAAAIAGIPCVTSEFATTDDDFPDYWHLRASRAREYSTFVAAEYLTVTNAAVAEARHQCERGREIDPSAGVSFRPYQPGAAPSSRQIRLRRHPAPVSEIARSESTMRGQLK